MNKVKNLLLGVLIFSIISCQNEKKQSEDIALDEVEVYEPSKLDNDTFSNSIKGLDPEILKFVSEKEFVIDTCISDMNNDGKNDIAIVVSSKNESINSNVLRKLIVLSKDSLNSYYIVTQTDKLISNLGGDEIFLDIIIKNRNLIVEHTLKSNEQISRLLEFSFSKKENTWILVNDKNIDASNSEKIIEKTYNSKDFGIVKIEDYSNEIAIWNKVKFPN